MLGFERSLGGALASAGLLWMSGAHGKLSLARRRFVAKTLVQTCHCLLHFIAWNREVTQTPWPNCSCGSVQHESILRAPPSRRWIDTLSVQAEHAE
jgi:hypothetical protein